MIFHVSRHLFAPGAARVTDLIALLRAAAWRGHTLMVIDDPARAEADTSVALVQWAEILTSPLRIEVMWLLEAVERITPNAATRGSPCIWVAQNPAATPTPQYQAQLDLQAAIRLAAMPLLILVENALSDGEFLRRTLPKNWRTKFIEWERDGFVQFEHGGGVGELKRIVEHCARGTGDPLGLGQAVWRCAHLVISDRDSTDEQAGAPSTAVTQLRTSCSNARMTDRLHVLLRRDQESYLPREAVDQIIASKTDARLREQMTALIDLHFANPTRHHAKMPALGQSSWFKNAFLEHGALPWQDDWFARDGSEPEMIDLAERIAAFL